MTHITLSRQNETINSSVSHKTLVWVDSETLKSNQSCCQSTSPGLRTLLTLKKHLKLSVCSFSARANKAACLGEFQLLLNLFPPHLPPPRKNRRKKAITERITTRQVHIVRGKLLWGCFLEQNNKTVCVTKLFCASCITGQISHDVLDWNWKCFIWLTNTPLRNHYKTPFKRN